jgi:hypothetical protein
MGADWRDLTWWQYTAMLTVWNERHAEPGEKPPVDFTELKRNMAAARTH